MNGWVTQWLGGLGLERHRSDVRLDKPAKPEWLDVKSTTSSQPLKDDQADELTAKKSVSLQNVLKADSAPANASAIELVGELRRTICTKHDAS